MCYVNILPIAIKIEDSESELARLTFIFNRWAKLLSKYGKLDGNTLNDDFLAIAKVIKHTKITKQIKKAVLACRDSALTQNMIKLSESLLYALELMSTAQDAPELKQIRDDYADQGMTERYKPLSRRLSKEYIRKLNKDLVYTDVDLDDSRSAKLVRRIVEKRAAQQVYKNCNGSHNGNRFRQSVRRAKSFSLYFCNQYDSESLKRAAGSHWKIWYNPETGKKTLKKKHPYATCEEAQQACKMYCLNHPSEEFPMHVYKCGHCGNWHIGHDRQYVDSSSDAKCVS